MKTIALAALCVALVVFHPTTAEAHSPPTAPATALAARCEALMAEDLSTVPDAPTRVNSAKLIEAAAGKPAYCEVEGYVAPQVGILMWLPAETWNGRFLEVGCGGFCGITAFIMMCEDPLKRGYACITTDMGHRGTEVGGVEWAYNNPQAVMDFAFRATHVTAVAGKAIVQSYYGRKPEQSYFVGCSCGGRQALVEAQRFPWDFDGIVVGAPGIDYRDIAIDFALRARRLLDQSGKPRFDAEAVKLVGAAVVAQCDMNDGLKDGQIGDPRLCKFDPRDLVCKPGATSACLTQDQVEAASAFYAEEKSASGRRLGDRALLPGSEVSYMGLGDNPLLKRSFYEDFFKYMALIPNPGPAWKFESFDLESDYQRLGLIHSLLQADNPDLREFKAAGGKLIFFHGWADAGPSPLTSIEYYKTIERTMGGRAVTQDFLRLFMVPDMDHCMGGKGPWQIDFLGYLEQWVEQGKAPDVLIGAHHSDDPMAPIPSASDKPQFTRPIYPYPMRAHYKGSGDPNSASSFKAVSSE